MENGTIALILIPLLLSPVVLMIWMHNAGKKKSSKDPGKVIRRVQSTHDPETLRNIYRKWENPEIRRAVALHPDGVAVAGMLDYMNLSEQNEVLACYTDPEPLRVVARNCSRQIRQNVEGRALELYTARFLDDPDPDWLVSVIRGDAEPQVRKGAAEALKDPERVAKCAAWAAGEPCGEEIFRTLLKNLKDPDPDWLVSVIQGNGSLPIREAAAEALKDPERLADCAVWAACSPRSERLFWSLLGRLDDPEIVLSHPEAAKIPEPMNEKIHEYELDRIAGDPALTMAYEADHPGELCRSGRHDWKKYRTKIVAHDDYRMNSPYLLQDILRCTRCGATKEGPEYKRMTCPEL